MTAIAEPDPVSRAIITALDRLRRTNVDVTISEGIYYNEDVVEPITFAASITDPESMPDLPEEVQHLIQEQTAELVALASIVRTSNDEPRLSESEVRLTKGFTEYIFNNIFRR